MKTAISLTNSSLEDDKHNLTRYISERGESRLSEEDKDEFTGRSHNKKATVRIYNLKKHNIKI